MREHNLPVTSKAVIGKVDLLSNQNNYDDVID